MKRFIDYILKICSRGAQLKEKILNKRLGVLIGFLFFVHLRWPLRFFLVETFHFSLAYSVMCGICALLITEVLSNYNNKRVSSSMFKILTTFTVAVIFSQLALNYNILLQSN